MAGYSPNLLFARRWSGGGRHCSGAGRWSANLSAFTLIELLVVIALIAILAALLFPVLSAAKARGQSAYCKGNLRQMGTAMRLYLDANNFNFPPYAVLARNAKSSWYWFDDLAPYLANTKVPSNMYAVGDAVTLREPNGSIIGLDSYGVSLSIVTFQQQRVARFPHAQRYNMLFVDGHIESAPPNILLATNGVYTARWWFNNSPLSW